MNYLNLESSLVLLNDLLLQFLSGLSFLFSRFPAFDLLNFLFLIPDHLLHTGILQVFLLLLHVKQFSLLSFFKFESFSFFDQLSLMLFFRHLNGFFDLTLHSLVPFSKHPLFKFLLISPLFLDPLLFLIPLFNLHNLFGFLLRIFNLFPRLFHKVKNFRVILYCLPFSLPS